MKPLTRRRQPQPRPWRLMYRDTDPRCHDGAHCLGTYRTQLAAERAQAKAVVHPGVAPEHFHTWVELREGA